MKKDVFNGKVKREYVGYVWFGLILFFLLCAAVGGLLLYVAITAKSGDHVPFFKFLFGLLGVGSILLGLAYMLGGIYVIRTYPAHEKWRHRLFNSDIYFVGCDTDEYRGCRYTRWGRRNALAHEMVVMAAEVDRMARGVKMPLKYKIYSTLLYIIFAVDFGGIAAMAYLDSRDPTPVFWEQNKGLLGLLFIGVMIASVPLAISLYGRAAKIQFDTAIDHEFEWRGSLRQVLWDLSVRKYVKPGKKRKYWYRPDQLEEIQALVDEAPAALSLKVAYKEGAAASFTVVEDDEGEERVFFRGFFVR